MAPRVRKQSARAQEAKEESDASGDASELSEEEEQEGKKPKRKRPAQGAAARGAKRGGAAVAAAAAAAPGDEDGEPAAAPPKKPPAAKKAKKQASGGKAAEEGEGQGGDGYYLMKSEPHEFSLDDLAAMPEQTSHWEGVRNYQARKIMRGMKEGQLAFFYHSSCKVPAIVGIVRIAREAYPDSFQFDKKSKYYDEASTPDNPRWWMVDVALVRRMERPVTLAELRAEGAKGPPVSAMTLINSSRLSVQPVTAAQWERILQLEKQPAPA